MRLAEGLQPEEKAARHQRWVYRKERVFGRGADQDHPTVLDRLQQRVLLALVEAMDLVDEEDRAAARWQGCATRLDCLSNVGDPGADRRKFDDVRAGGRRQDRSQRRFARARRPPEDQRGKLTALSDGPERRAWPDQVLLPHELVQRVGTHPGRQRCGTGDGCRLLGGKKALRELIALARHRS